MIKIVRIHHESPQMPRERKPKEKKRPSTGTYDVNKYIKIGQTIASIMQKIPDMNKDEVALSLNRLIPDIYDLKRQKQTGPKEIQELKGRKTVEMLIEDITGYLSSLRITREKINQIKQILNNL